MLPGLIPQRDGSYAISLELPGTKIEPQVLRTLASWAEKGALVHPTTAQKIMILGLSPEEAPKALAEFEAAGAKIRKSGKSLQPRTCVGLPYCKLALQETFPFSEAIYQAFPIEELPHKFKVAISGCPACCSWANLLDLGFVGVRSGFKVFVGGKGGYQPEPGHFLTTIKDATEAISLMRKILDYFKQHGRKKRRFATLVKEDPEELRRFLAL